MTTLKMLGGFFRFVMLPHHVRNNGILLLSSVLLFLSFLELGLRLTGSQWELARRGETGNLSRLTYFQDAVGLARLTPDQRGRWKSGCFDTAPVSTNSLGYRGLHDWPNAGGIALLGDSFIEALQIPDGLTIADHLGKLLGSDILNASISGFANTSELLAFKSAFSEFRPDTVILFVYLGNDISGNSCSLSKTQPPCGEMRDGKLILRMPSVKPEKASSSSSPLAESSDEASVLLRSFLRRHLALYHAAHDLKMILFGLFASDAPAQESRWSLYDASLPQKWREAWEITEAVIAELKRETSRKGSRLILVSIPEPISFLPNPQAAIRFGAGAKPPNNFDISFPSKQLEEIAARVDLPLLSLFPIFNDYRNSHQLPAPYMSFACDGHWNPLAHKLAAAALADFLGKGNNLNELIDLAPNIILGNDAYDAIYGGGVYRPISASVTKRLEEGSAITSVSRQ